jgi:hypothetical protein
VVAGAVGFVAGAVGMAVVLVLVFRSIAEWRDQNRKGTGTPGR